MRSVVAALAALGILAGCGLGEAGMPLPKQQAGVAYPGNRQDLAGVLDVSDFGCFNLALDDEHFLVIWPAGSDYADQDDEYALQLPSGEVIADGDGVVGTGAFTPTAPLLAERDSSLAYAIRGCAPDAAEVIVFDTAERG